MGVGIGPGVYLVDSTNEGRVQLSVPCSLACIYIYTPPLVRLGALEPMHAYRSGFSRATHADHWPILTTVTYVIGSESN